MTTTELSRPILRSMAFYCLALWGTAAAEGCNSSPTANDMASAQEDLSGMALDLDGGDTACSPVSLSHSASYVPNTRQTVVLDSTLYPNAKCNDGTPGVYFIRKGFGDAKQRWVIWLQGGGNCYDQTSCNQRITTNPDEISTKQYVAGTGTPPSVDGIESGDPTHNPDFYDANNVHILYCSSDYWSGARAGDPTYPFSDVRSWSFQGRAIIQAVLQDLVTKQGLGSAQDVLLAGGSAGGVGVFLNAAEISNFFAGKARLVAMPDAGYGIDVSGYSSTAADGVSPAVPTPTEQLIASATQIWGGHSNIECQNGVASADVQNCYSPEYLTHNGYIHMPMFIRQSEDDKIQLALNGVTAGSPPASEHSYARYFANQMYTELQTADANLSVFVTDDTNHEMVDSATFYQAEETFGASAPTTIATQLGLWYRQPCSPLRELQAPQ